MKFKLYSWKSCVFFICTYHSFSSTVHKITSPPVVSSKICHASSPSSQDSSGRRNSHPRGEFPRRCRGRSPGRGAEMSYAPPQGTCAPIRYCRALNTFSASSAALAGRAVPSQSRTASAPQSQVICSVPTAKVSSVGMVIFLFGFMAFSRFSEKYRRRHPVD